ncbi:hypothetical protein B0H66DRAFT_178893 [Apodospora peruviana]|uniref:Uncharacterized protein n=1 Tax=Apodospora peruviana TaxID=516989 RepID=A0AAE0IB21_9PEZI|nr:hypothetical protein B0H66DRAFT_178893 [Apodospora peruviana]
MSRPASPWPAASVLPRSPLDISLAGTAYGARRMYVASEKLSMIEAELRKRGEDLHKTTAKDVLIPLGIGAVTLGVGVGLEAVIDGSAAQGAISSSAEANPGPAVEAAVQEVFTDPGQLVHDAIQEMEMQVHEIGALVTGGQASDMIASNIDVSFITGGLDAANPGLLVGLAAGMALAHVAEVQAAKWTTGRVTTFLVGRDRRGKGQGFVEGVVPETCKRQDAVMYSRCGNGFSRQTTSYFHCCACEDDGFLCCDTCAESNGGCLDPENHVMTRVVNTETPDSCLTMRSVARDVRLPNINTTCARCHTSIKHRDYYRMSQPLPSLHSATTHANHRRSDRLLQMR